MLKILQARLQQYVKRELPDVEAGFRKGRGTREQIAPKLSALTITIIMNYLLYLHRLSMGQEFENGLAQWSDWRSHEVTVKTSARAATI